MSSILGKSSDWLSLTLGPIHQPSPGDTGRGVRCSESPDGSSAHPWGPDIRSATRRGWSGSKGKQGIAKPQPPQASTTSLTCIAASNSEHRI